MTPYFHSLAEFFAMGKHGAYVWGSYALSFAFIFGIIIYSRLQRQKVYRDVMTQQARQNQRKHTAKNSNT